MAPFSESVSIIDSPLNAYSEEYYVYDAELALYESHRQVQRRMVIIMIGVLCIISAMAFVVLPEQSAVSGAGVQPAAALAAESVILEPAVVPETAAAVVEAVPAAGGTIAALFTPEVQVLVRRHCALGCRI